MPSVTSGFLVFLGLTSVPSVTSGFLGLTSVPSVTSGFLAFLGLTSVPSVTSGFLAFLGLTSAPSVFFAFLGLPSVFIAVTSLVVSSGIGVTSMIALVDISTSIDKIRFISIFYIF